MIFHAALLGILTANLSEKLGRGGSVGHEGVQWPGARNSVATEGVEGPGNAALGPGSFNETANSISLRRGNTGKPGGLCSHEGDSA